MLTRGGEQLAPDGPRRDGASRWPRLSPFRSCRVRTRHTSTAAPQSLAPARSPLRLLDCSVAGWCALFTRPSRLIRSARSRRSLPTQEYEPVRVAALPWCSRKYSRRLRCRQHVRLNVNHAGSHILLPTAAGKRFAGKANNTRTTSRAARRNSAPQGRTRQETRTRP